MPGEFGEKRSAAPIRRMEGAYRRDRRICTSGRGALVAEEHACRPPPGRKGPAGAAVDFEEASGRLKRVRGLNSKAGKRKAEHRRADRETEKRLNDRFSVKRIYSARTLQAVGRVLRNCCASATIFEGFMVWLAAGAVGIAREVRRQRRWRCWQCQPCRWRRRQCLRASCCAALRRFPQEGALPTRAPSLIVRCPELGARIRG